jgi:hypothetical protein
MIRLVHPWIHPGDGGKAIKLDPLDDRLYREKVIRLVLAQDTGPMMAKLASSALRADLD